MCALRVRRSLVVTLAFGAACASAGDRLNEGIELQARGRYMEAVYRYAEAVEKDGSLMEARDRLITSGDSALLFALDEAEGLARAGDPVRAAARYQDIDRMLARIRSVGERLDSPADYGPTRRSLFDRAIAWRMDVGEEARLAGRWQEARDAFAAARNDFEPSRDQVEASMEAETRLLLEWADVELEDGRPRTAYDVAHQALAVRGSPARDVVLSVRELQHRALEAGTVVVAVPPVTARGGVRERLGPEFEIRLDEALTLDHWTQPPPFVRMADQGAMRRELRGLLRGVPQSPVLVGRVLQLVGADFAAIVEVAEVEVVEEEVERATRQTTIVDGGREGSRPPRPTAYEVVTGTLAYRALADIVLVDHDGREVTRFRAEGGFSGPFERGEFDGNPDRLQLTDAERALFDARFQAEQVAVVERGLMEELAVAIAAGTYDTVLSRIP